jgi:catechol 2,3-dioxygenase-like lactoylglutathione lyase family enzyme
MSAADHFFTGFQDFQHVAVTVSDIHRSLAFYRDLLGFPALGRLYFGGETGMVIDFLDIGNNALLEIFSFDNVAAKPSDFVYDDRQLGLRHMGFRVGSVDTVAARVRQAGVEFTLDPLDAVGGVRIAFFKDPDGTLVEIVEGELDYHLPGQARLPVAVPARGAPSGSELTYDHVAVTVADLPRSLDFYKGVLGLPLLGQLDFKDDRGFRIAYLQLGNSVLELFAFAAPTISPVWNPDVTELGLKHIALLVGDVDAVSAQLGAQGVPIIRPPRAVRTLRNCLVADPDGNAVELIDGTFVYDK